MVANGLETKQALKGGLVAGVVAGAALSVFLMVMTLVKGLDVWSNVFKGAAAPFLGTAVTSEPGFALGPVALGIVSHLAVSSLWGLAFGLIAFGLSKAMTMFASALWGLVVWVGMFYVVLPAVGLVEMARGASVASGIIYHLVFGLVMGAVFLPFQRAHQVHVGGFAAQGH